MRPRFFRITFSTVLCFLFQTERELMTISEQRRIAMRSCLDALSQYAAVAAHFPPQAALRQHRESIWSNRLEQMMDGLINLDITAVRNEVTKSKAKETLVAQVLQPGI